VVYSGTMRKNRMNVYLEPEQKTKLTKISQKTGAPVAELIRRAINVFLKDFK
jgi:predicted DNA-binding protein